MQIIILCTEAQKKEITIQEGTGHLITFIQSFGQFEQYKDADVFIDLTFDMEPGKITFFKTLSKTVIIHSVEDTLEQMNVPFIRINGWPTFLKPFVAEASGNSKKAMQEAEAALQTLGRKIEWLPDEPGFVTARVICCIINEAYFALADGVSTKEEMDAAMKLGTAYPYGPFEWASLMGLKNVAGLLLKLSKKNIRYQPCPLLMEEAYNQKDFDTP